MYGNPIVSIALACLVVVPTVVGAQSAPAPADDPAEQEGWAPPGAGDDGFTWIRLATGEWVKGEIKDLRDGTVSFDSDELDEFEYDWADVTAVITSAPHTVTTWDRETWTGFILARQTGGIRILDADGIEIAVVDPDDVSSMIEGDASERNFWSGLVSAGSTVRYGNSDQRDGNLLVRLTRRALITRWDNTVNLSYAESGGSKNQETQRGTSRFDVFVSPNFFYAPLGYEYFRDPFQNVEQRHTPGMGFGYDRDVGPVSWDTTAGVAWQYTRFASVPEGDDRTDEVWVGRIGASADWDITSDIEFELDYTINFPFEDFGAYTSNMLAVLSVDLFWNFEADLTWAWDRQNAPQAAADGFRPEKDDHRLTTAIGWDF